MRTDDRGCDWLVMNDDERQCAPYDLTHPCHGIIIIEQPYAGEAPQVVDDQQDGFELGQELDRGKKIVIEIKYGSHGWRLEGESWKTYDGRQRMEEQR